VAEAVRQFTAKRRPFSAIARGMLAGVALALRAAMARRGSTRATATPNDDFDLPARLSILRRAVATLAILSEGPGATSVTVTRELGRYAALASASVALVSQSARAGRDARLHRTCSAAAEAVLEVERRLEALPVRRASRLALEMIRRRLYGALAALSERLAPTDAPRRLAAAPPAELERALAMRQLVTDFHGAMLAIGRKRSQATWALIVAEAELAIVLELPAFALGPEAQQKKLSSLHARIARFRSGRRDASSKTKLLDEVFDASSLLSALNLRADVKRHDARALAELSLLLTRSALTLAIAANAAETLAELRGMDPELDRWMLELPFDPARVLQQVRRRVSELRACALAS
jgi:hypothetical protein